MTVDQQHFFIAIACWCVLVYVIDFRNAPKGHNERTEAMKKKVKKVKFNMKGQKDQRLHDILMPKPSKLSKWVPTIIAVTFILAIMFGLFVTKARATTMTQTSMAVVVGAGTAYGMDALLPAVPSDMAQGQERDRFTMGRRAIIVLSTVFVSVVYEATRKHVEEQAFDMANVFSSSLGTLAVCTVKF